jgi:regulatory protein
VRGTEAADEPPPFKDAEAWLAARGVRREPLVLEPPSPPQAPGSGPAPGIDQAAGPDVSARDAARLVDQAAADLGVRDGDARALPDPSIPHLEDDIAEAVAFLRRSTSVAPQAEGRLRDKLRDRGFVPAAIEGALQRARTERLVDDLAMATALVAERRRKGHALARVRRDLRERGFDEATLDAALATAEREDPEAAAFSVARDKAVGLTALDPETAFRRVVGHVVRRGYPEGLARKVAREAVFTARDADRTAGH